MPGSIHVELNSVHETLLLPLWGRAVESKKQRPMLVDETAVEIMQKIDYDFSTIARSMSPITQIAWIARSLHVDRTIRHIRETHPRASIVNIGCGLDTTFHRIDNGLLQWYDVDLPEVIELRKKLIPVRERSVCIASSFLDSAWRSQIAVENKVLFLAAGVFYYFEEREIRDFMAELAGRFRGAEILFDIASPLGVKIANKRVIEAGGMNDRSYLKWGIASAKQIPSWQNGITLLEEYPMFKRMRKGLSLRNKYGTFLSDRLHVMSMVHLKFS